MADRRDQLVEAGLQVLREEGLAGFSQARIAAKVGLRQGHLTYYYPTRTDLLAAVARKAVENQLAGLAQAVVAGETPEGALAALAAASARHENTRVLVALNQAADQEPELRSIFQDLNGAFVRELGALLQRLGLGGGQDRVDLIHALFVGLSVIELATSREDGLARNRAALAVAFRLLAAEPPPTAAREE